MTQRIKRAWEIWKVVAHKVGTFQARLLLTILYVSFVLPFGTWMRLFADPLRIKKLPQQWLEHDDQVMDIDGARKQ